MEIIAVNDVPVSESIKPLIPRSLRSADEEARNFALRLVLAGDHVKDRKFTLRYNGKTSDYYPDKNGMLLENIQHDSNIETKQYGSVGYIKINDCLYNSGLVREFDSVMQTMQKTSALILDLRETPSGGNTVVARAIISWFIKLPQLYQKHDYYAEELQTGIKRSWVEIVSPRESKGYTNPVVVLCSHWTASLGEAIIIGIAGLKRSHTTTIGTPMARLYGAVYSYQMPNTKIGFTFPAERLYTVNGLPREKYVPEILIDPAKRTNSKNEDIFISRALEYFKNKR